jgi:two-component system phosphate regulon response regulator PhoB
MAAHILVVDPDPAIRQLLALNLSSAGHDAASCLDAESALVLIDDSLPEMLLLEWDLPGQSGEALIRRLRAKEATRELLARMGAVLRRRAPHVSSETVQMAGLRLDPGTQRVIAGSRQVALGPVEFRLLNFLMHHPERVHTRSQLLDKVWGRHAVLDERTVDTHVGRLRNALQPSGHQEHFETVRGTGYRFVAWNARADWSGAA